jgi:hypothetical protein
MTVQFATPMGFPPFFVFELPCRQVTVEPTLIDICSSDLHLTSAQGFPCSINVACAYQNSQVLRSLPAANSLVYLGDQLGSMLG